MERTYCVYKHTNKVNGKVYIGITCKQDPRRRWAGGFVWQYATDDTSLSM